MKAYRWGKQRISDKWYTVCTSHEHVPMIEHLKDGRYKVTGNNGKARIEKEFGDAIKFAIETHKRMQKFNKKWEQ